MKFSDEHLMIISGRSWFADMANYKATKNIYWKNTFGSKRNNFKQFYKKAKHYFWDEPYLFCISADGLICMSVAGKEAKDSSANGYHH